MQCELAQAACAWPTGQHRKAALQEVHILRLVALPQQALLQRGELWRARGEVKHRILQSAYVVPAVDARKDSGQRHQARLAGISLGLSGLHRLPCAAGRVRSAQTIKTSLYCILFIVQMVLRTVVCEPSGVCQEQDSNRFRSEIGR